MSSPRIYREEDIKSKCLIFKVVIPYNFIVSNEHWNIYVISMLIKMMQRIINDSGLTPNPSND